MHISVLKQEIVNTFDYMVKSDGFFVDGTLGMAGHSLAILNNNKQSNYSVIGIDKDTNALKIAKENIAEAGYSNRFVFVHNDFTHINEIIADLKINKIDGALIDLGVSSLQLDDKERGFSFSDPEAFLDMRMDTKQKLDAGTILNEYPETKLMNLLYTYGEEKYSRNIARNICDSRKKKPILKVSDLLTILEKSIPAKVRMKSKKHYATNVFRALRIEVNNELDPLEQALRDFIELLAPHGRLAVISFHSTEDRIIKNLFRDLARDCTCPEGAPICICGGTAKVKLLTKKPIIPSESELASNPRSRSAKLRIVEKI